MDKIINKFYTIGRIIRLNPKVFYLRGTLECIVELIPTKHNIVNKNNPIYVNIYDVYSATLYDINSGNLIDFLKYTGIKDSEFCDYLLKKI